MRSPRVEESAQRLLHATVELIAEQGFRATTTAQISARAGFSNAMVHVRYGSKEKLLEELLRTIEIGLLKDPAPDEAALDAILGQIDSLQVQVRDWPELLRAFCVLAFEAVGSGDVVSGWLRDWRARYITHTATVLRAGQADGSIRRSVEPDAEALVFMDFATGLCFRWTLEPDHVDLSAELDAWRERLRAWLGAWSP